MKPDQSYLSGHNLPIVVTTLMILTASFPLAVACQVEKIQKQADELTNALKLSTWKEHTIYTDTSDVQYFSDLSLDTGDHDHSALKKDESFVNNAEGFLEEQQLRFLRQERERLADERDAARRQQLVLHIHHLQQNRYHVPKLLRRNKRGRIISDEEAERKRGGMWRYVKVGLSNWPSLLGLIIVYACDVLAFGAAFIIPISMIRILRRPPPGLMAGTGVRTPPSGRSRSGI